MFYDIDCAQTDRIAYGGGAQDNGTLITQDGQPDAFFEFLGGDGGWIIVDPKAAGHIYASYQYGGMYRFRNGTYANVSPPFKPEDMGGVWMVYTTFDPKDTNTVYTGNQRVYRTKNDGQSWAALTPVLDGSPISAIEVAPADPKACTSARRTEGCSAHSTAERTGAADLAGPELPGVMVTRIETHPTDATRRLHHRRELRQLARVPFEGCRLDLDRHRQRQAARRAAPRAAHPARQAEAALCVQRRRRLPHQGQRIDLDQRHGNLPNVMVVDLVFHDVDEATLRSDLRPQHLETAAHLNRLRRGLPRPRRRPSAACDPAGSSRPLRSFLRRAHVGSVLGVFDAAASSCGSGERVARGFVAPLLIAHHREGYPYPWGAQTRSACNSMGPRRVVVVRQARPDRVRPGQCGLSER